VNRLEAARERQARAVEDVQRIETAICAYMQENEFENVVIGEYVIEYQDEHLTVKKAQRLK